MPTASKIVKMEKPLTLMLCKPYTIRWKLGSFVEFVYRCGELGKVSQLSCLKLLANGSDCSKNTHNYIDTRRYPGDVLQKSDFSK